MYPRGLVLLVYKQLIGGDIDSVETLCHSINEHFVWLTSFTPLSRSNVSSIMVKEIPAKLLVSEVEVFKAPQTVKTGTSMGADRIPNIVLKTFSYDLAPVLADSFNASLHEGYLSPLLKSAMWFVRCQTVTTPDHSKRHQAHFLDTGACQAV